jgi:membrane protein YqaA with SNARE-associated domain
MNVAPTDPAPPIEQPLTGMRLWFVGFLAWMITLALVAQASFGAFEAGSDTGRVVWLLALLAFYLSLCNGLLPLPTGWIVLLIASDMGLPGVPPALRISLVAVVGGLGTMMANLNEYHVLSHRLGARLRDRLRQTGAYRWALRWFDRAPFGALSLVAFVPIPIDAVRWLALLRRYSRVRFALAYFLGRGGRYAIFAALSVIFSFGAWEILFVQLGIIVVAVGGKMLIKQRSVEKSVGAEAGDDLAASEDVAARA